MADQKYLSQYRSPSGTIFRLKDRELREALTGYNALRQLVVTYLLPEWNHATGPYAKGAVVRCQGRVFESKVDGNVAPPFEPIADEDGSILVDENWNVIITERVDEQNWAHLQDTNPRSLPEMIADMQEQYDAAFTDITSRLSAVEQFLASKTFITE